MADVENVPPLGRSQKKKKQSAVHDKAEPAPIWNPPVIPEHPDGDAIRRQVEWYFSDENLLNDPFLLSLCGGSRNEPVSINRIMGFKRMRQYKPKSQVIESLKKSLFLEVVGNGKYIRRKVSLVVNEDDSFIADSPLQGRTTEVGGMGLPQSKLPTQSATFARLSSDAPPKPTGFEDWYAEGPITPAENEEDEELYGPETTFSERIELAIQRYRSRRKFKPDHARFFDSFLKFGGIDAGPRQFANVDRRELEGMTAYDKTRIAAVHHVSEDKEDAEKWAVDFEGVAKAYLSSYFAEVFEYSEHDVEIACKVMVNFYNYLLLHNVCSEHDDSILSARQLCTSQAKKELLLIQTAGLHLPGPFNRACSYLFGPSQSTFANQEWHHGTSFRNENEAIIRAEESRITFRTGVAAMGSNAMFDLISNEDTNKVTGQPSITTGLEIVDITHASPETSKMYAAATGSKLALDPLGILTCKPWLVPDFAETDLPRGHLAPGQSQLPGKIRFWVEQRILRIVYVGMKMEVDVRKLDFGGSDELWILDGVTRTYCSFHRYLLNELMPKPWKEVKWVKHDDTEVVNEANEADDQDEEQNDEV